MYHIQYRVVVIVIVVIVIDVVDFTCPFFLFLPKLYWERETEKRLSLAQDDDKNPARTSVNFFPRTAFPEHSFGRPSHF